MVLDSVNVDSLEKAADKAEIDTKKAALIVDGFYKGLIRVIETEKTIIKVPFLGKFIYSESWKQKKAAINKAFCFNQLKFNG